MTIDDTATLTDDDLLAEVRAECARWDTRDDLEQASLGSSAFATKHYAAGCRFLCPAPWRTRLVCPNDARVDLRTVGDTT